ncbi:hypothetical protein IQ259_16350 [Fortiea sp. LEGE XX443]|uniref:hypothetical protein n=1 Tax=Fortiea sp. LEGE XX443 TaxID=1828611 RepID=UPI001A0C1C94|nr:hypothetical protein [Fortiea sp. LEGE XX443]
MARTLTELHSTLAEPFHSCENFFQELSDTDSVMIHGGKTIDSSQDSNCEQKLLEYELVKCAISDIMSIIKSFIDSSQSRSQNCISSSEKLQIEKVFKQCCIIN